MFIKISSIKNGFPCYMISGQGTEILFSMEFEILGLGIFWQSRQYMWKIKINFHLNVKKEICHACWKFLCEIS